MYFNHAIKRLEVDKVDILIISLLIFSSSRKKFKRESMVQELMKIKKNQKLTFSQILQKTLNLLNDKKLINFLFVTFKVTNIEQFYCYLFELQSNVTLLLEILKKYICKKHYRKMIFNLIRKNFQIKLSKKKIIKKILWLFKIYLSRIFIQSCLNQLIPVYFDKFAKLKHLYSWIMFFLLGLTYWFSIYLNSTMELFWLFFLLKSEMEQKASNLLSRPILLKKNYQKRKDLSQTFISRDEPAVKVLMSKFIEEESFKQFKNQNQFKETPEMEMDPKISCEIFKYFKNKVDEISDAISHIQTTLDSGESDGIAPAVRRYTTVVTDASAMFDRRKDIILGLSA